MTAFYLYDDAIARRFEPFALTRPVGELRAGALLVRERWAQLLGVPCGGSISSPHLADFDEPEAAPVVSGELPAGSILVNARALPSLSASVAASSGTVRVAERVAAIRLEQPLDAARFGDGTQPLEGLAAANAEIEDLPGRWLDAVWDLVASIDAILPDDILAIARQRGTSAARPEGCAGVGATDGGANAIYVEEGATVEPFVTFDLSTGPVYLERGATLQSFTRVQGPCWIGRDSIVGCDRIASLVVGDTCKVHGESSHTIYLGHCNKSHDGFVGHSYLGRWVNIGANTVTSNLKNTYGTIELWTPDGMRDSGQQFLGTLFGDHAKTGIGLKLTTGTVIGACAQVYGVHMPPKAVAPFSWGDHAPYDVYLLDKFLGVAARMMSRRKIELSDKARRQLSAAHEVRWSVEA